MRLGGFNTLIGRKNTRRKYSPIFKFIKKYNSIVTYNENINPDKNLCHSIVTTECNYDLYKLKVKTLDETLEKILKNYFDDNCIKQFIQRCLQNDDLDTIKQLVSTGTLIPNKELKDIIYKAVLSKDSDLIKLLDKYNYNIRKAIWSVGYNGVELMHHACKYDNYNHDIIKILIKKKCIEHNYYATFNVFYYAVIQHDLKMINFLHDKNMIKMCYIDPLVLVYQEHKWSEILKLLIDLEYDTTELKEHIIYNEKIYVLDLINIIKN